MRRLLILGFVVAGLAACEPTSSDEAEAAADMGTDAAGPSTGATTDMDIPDDAMLPEEPVPADAAPPTDEMVESPPMPADPDNPGASPPVLPEGQR